MDPEQQIEQLKQQLAESQAEAKAHQDAIEESKRQADADQKLADGKLKEALEEANKTLGNTKGELDKYRERDKGEAEKLYKGLPKEAKARADKVKDHLDVTQYLDYLRAETPAETHGVDADDKAPNYPTSNDRHDPVKRKNYKVKHADFIRENFHVEPEHLDKMEYEEDGRSGNRRFTLPMHIFRRTLVDRAINGVKMTLENAMRRKPQG